ncbi:hypothetical protein ACHAWF_014998 [Thalassiosira exigua]
MLSKRAPPALAVNTTSSDDNDDDKQVDPRAALTAMLSKRPPTPTVDTTTSDEADDKQVDPRAALNAMLSKRALPTPVAEATTPDDNDGNQADPRAALNAMLSKRAAPTPALETGASGDDNDKQVDPRAALNAMLSKRAPPTSAVDTTASDEADDRQADPRVALNAMLSKRAPPTPVAEVTTPDDNDGNQADPRASLNAMLSKRAPHVSSITTTLSDDDGDKQVNPRAALNAMLSKRTAPTPVVDTSTSDGDDDKKVDPRAALKAMLSERAPPTPEVSATVSNEQTNQDVPKAALNAMLKQRAPSASPVEGTNHDDPRAALMSMLSKRVPPMEGNDGESQNQEAEQEDPRAALMSMLSKRAPSAQAIWGQSSNEQSKDEDPRAALMSVLSKRVPPAQSSDNLPESQGTKQEDPRAALMSMLNKRAHAQTMDTQSSLQESKEEHARSALMSVLSKRASPSPASSQDGAKSDDPRAALMSMLNKRAPNLPGGTQSPNPEVKQDDPRANLMAAISKREPPTPGQDPKPGGPMQIGAMAAAAALKKRVPAGAENGSTQSAAASPEGSTEKGPPSIREDPRFSKYFKMLKMGLPMGAVKNAMQRDQQDPSVMDLDPEKSLESQRPPENKSAAEDGPPLNKDPAYEKGLPMGSVKNAMQRDGLDPGIMDLDPNKSVASQMKKDDDGPPLKEDPKYSKYFKMLKMGLPMGAVKNALQRDGLDPSIMDLDPEKSVASQVEKEEEEEEDTGPPLKEDPKYSKGLPMGAVKNAIQRDGLDPSIMDLDPEKSVASQLDQEEDTGPALKDDPKYSKYFKMLKMGLPMGPVKNALQRDGLDPSVMDLDPEKSVASQQGKEEDLVDKGPPLTDDPKYSKYFKMLKMGLPMGAVKNALQRDGLDPSIMDLDPEKSVEYQRAMASGKGKVKKKKTKKVLSKDPKKPKVRRKKLFWSPIEESKIDDNSLWSMVKGTFNFDSLNVDQDEFQNLFTDTSNPADKKKVASDKPAASKQKKSVQVIDAKRGMNGGIILARIKSEFSVLAEMVTEMDCGKLDDTQLKALREFLPTKDEKFAIEGYIKGASSSSKTREAAINDFCACEKYMLAMMKVEMADEKFEAMLFKYQFDNKLKELMEGVTTLISACEEVQKSVRLRKLMAMILMLGNQINTGGSGRMAQGFTLDALLKLDEAKAFDKKTSVLQYLVKLVRANEPNLLNVHEEMPSIGPAENVIVETFVSELKELDEQLTSVKGTAAAEGQRKREGKAQQRTESALDRLRHQKTKIKDVEGVHMYNQPLPVELTAMEKFSLYAEKRTKEAFARIDEVQENFKGVLSYFGEDPAMTSADFFGTLNKFIATFDSALEVVKRFEALKLAEEKKAAAEEKKAAAKRAKQAAKKKSPAASKRAPDVAAKKSKGKLDLSGQRKKFADPFAGPDSNVKDESSPPKEPKALVSLSLPPKVECIEVVDKSAREDKEQPQTGPGPVDPRAALMAMISKRASTDEASEVVERQLSVRMDEEHVEVIDKSSQKKLKDTDAEQMDQRAALMAMISKRAPPGEAPKSPVQSQNARSDVASGGQRHDPKSAISAMLSQRATQPQSPPSPKNIPALAAAAAHNSEELASSSSSKKSGAKGFFPATSPKKDAPSARYERYETKTSSIARGGEAGLKSMPSLDHDDGDSKARNRINPNIEADAKTEAKVMLVAAMTAAAARKRTPVLATERKHYESAARKKSEYDNSEIEAEPMSTLAVSAAKKAAASNTNMEKEIETTLAAAETRKKAAVDNSDVETELKETLAKSAARKENNADNSEVEAELMSTLAASAAKNKAAKDASSGADHKDVSSSPVGALGTGSAASTQNQKTKPRKRAPKAESGDNCAPMGIAAMAAAAARKKNVAKSATKEAVAHESNSTSKGPEGNGTIADSTVPKAEKSVPTVARFLCSSCDKQLEKERFSKNQLSKLKKDEKGRCKQCIKSQITARAVQ